MYAGPASTPGRPGDLAIEAEGVVKRFGKVEALSGLDLVAQRGQVTAVLGPNGAGKTTFVRAVATLIRPQAGHCGCTASTSCGSPARCGG
jgi:ABC-2 type transport system ATP-binding protein